MLFIYIYKMDNFNAIFNGVKKDKMSRFYKNVRILTSVKKNKTQYSQNLINLIHLYSKLYKKSTPKNVTPKLLNKHFTMKDYRELFGSFRRSLMGGRTHRQKVSNLFALGKKTHALQRYFLEFDNPNVPGIDLAAINKIKMPGNPRDTQMIVDANLVVKNLNKFNNNMNEYDDDNSIVVSKSNRGKKYNRGKQAVGMVQAKRKQGKSDKERIKGKNKDKWGLDSNDSDNGDNDDMEQHPAFNESGFSWIQ